MRRYEDAADVARSEDFFNPAGRHGLAYNEFFKVKPDFFGGGRGSFPIEVKLMVVAQLFGVGIGIEPRQGGLHRRFPGGMPVMRQRGKEGIGVVAHFLCQVLDPRADRFGDPGVVVQRSGDRHRGDAGGVRNVTQRGPGANEWSFFG